MDDYELGYGLVRTRSGRITYAPDGVVNGQNRPQVFRPLWPQEPASHYPSDDEETVAEPEAYSEPYIADDDLFRRPHSPNPDALRDADFDLGHLAPVHARQSTNLATSSVHVPDPSFLQRSYSDSQDPSRRQTRRSSKRISTISGTTAAHESWYDDDPSKRRKARTSSRGSSRSNSNKLASRRSSSERKSVAAKSEGEETVVASEASAPRGPPGKPQNNASLAEPKKAAHGPPAGPPFGGPPGGPPQGPRDPNVVEWEGPEDPGNPMNWTVTRKWSTTIIMAAMTFTVTFASSVFSTATVVTAQKYGVSTEVMTLATSLFVLGFAFGPIVFGPLSELYGRRWPLFIGFFSFGIFQIAVAVAQNLYTIMICRFFGGFAASAPLAIVGATMNDFWNPVDRGVAVAVFSAAVFMGPVAGPIVGSYVTASYLGWRWTAYITAFMAFAFGFVGFIFIPESFSPVLLHKRAKSQRYSTGNWALHSKSDEQQVNLKRIGDTYLLKPFKMLIAEPILLLITLYMSLIYGILYLSFFSYPISFAQKRGWSDTKASLPFLAIIVGVLIGAAIIIWITKTRFARKMKQTGRVVPEERLIPMIIGAAVLPAGLFMFAWTSDQNITWVPQVLAGILIGCGLMMIFLQGLNYLIDVYKMNAASAIAANTFFRSWVGAGFPLFATYMYDKLGVAWATSLLGFLCVALFPVPILFFIFGAKIRAKGKYVPQIPPGGGPPGGRPGGGGGPPGGMGGPPMGVGGPPIGMQQLPGPGGPRGQGKPPGTGEEQKPKVLRVTNNEAPREKLAVDTQVPSSPLAQHGTGNQEERKDAFTIEDPATFRLEEPVTPTATAQGKRIETESPLTEEGPIPWRTSQGKAVSEWRWSDRPLMVPTAANLARRRTQEVQQPEQKVKIDKNRWDTAPSSPGTRPTSTSPSIYFSTRRDSNSPTDFSRPTSTSPSANFSRPGSLHTQRGRDRDSGRREDDGVDRLRM